MTTPSVQTVPQRKSKHCGVGSELSVFFKVKPGHAKALRDALTKWDADLSRAKGWEGTTLTDARYVLFDNDTRCFFGTNFDGPWDPYIEDVIRFIPAAFYEQVFSHFEGWPEGGIKNTSMDDLKKMIDSNQITATAYMRRFTDVTSKEMDKALRVQKAFQKVLDTPGAEKALEDPALQPLLAEASD